MAVSVRTHARPPFWRNVTILKWAAQIVVLLALLTLLFILGREAGRNFSRSDVSFGWDWLSDPPGIQIFEGIDTNPATGARALLVGIVNTLRVSVSGIFAATILGTLIGISRLSQNWIVKKIASIYIETIRNIPLLVQMFFWSALVTGFSEVTKEDVGRLWFKASRKGIALAWAFPSTGFWPWLIIVGLGGVAAHFVVRWRRRVMDETGEPARSFTYGSITVLGFAAVGWFLHPTLGFLRVLWDGIGSLIRDLPTIVVPLVVAVVAVAAAIWWIRNFFESRRTPAGFGKLTDDDWFRVVFVALAGIFVAFAAFTLAGASFEVPGGNTQSLAELVRNGTGNIFSWFGAKFTGASGSPLRFSRPAIEMRGAGFPQFTTDGLLITPPFFAVWVGVTLYTAAFIAEIVRAGILAVSKGQTEAAQALGLRRSQYLRMIILPQAFRIILPPMGNQYLNLAKNTSLGTAVAFAEIVAVGSTIMNQTGQSLPVVLVWMGFYLTMSLSISGIVNYYNRKMQLVER